MKRFSILLAFALTVGCRAQVPVATPYSVTLTWTAPSATSSWGGCTTSSPCVYAFYRCAGTSTVCATLSSTAWVEITTSMTRPSGTSYQDTTVTIATTYSYVIETVQGTANSAPSNMVTVTIPGEPPIGSPTAASAATIVGN
jgi:hypothetical protein